MLDASIRTLALYLVLVAALRLLGKRQVGQMEPSEFAVMMLLANLATVPVENLDLSIFYGIVPIILIYGAEMLFSVLTLRSIRLRKLLCGKPVILIENGKISERNLKRTRITLDELTMHLREKGIFDLNTIKFAILETNGQVSTLQFAKDMPATAKDLGQRVTETELPITLISDGRVMHNNLPLSGHDMNWLETQLRMRKALPQEVLLMTVDSAGHMIFIRKQKET